MTRVVEVSNERRSTERTMSSQGATLALQDVTYRYGASRTQAPAGVGPLQLSVAAGEFVCVVGPSGSGKSTLLSLLSGFLKPQAGQILLDQQVLRGPDQALTLVQQEHALFPWRTVLGNVMFGLESRRMPRAERQQRARAALEMVGLDGYADRRVHELSGGQRQRVSLARALALRPRLLLLDEPFSALDVNTRATLGQELLTLWQRQGSTVLFVTHNLDEALSLGQRVVALRAGAVALDQLAEELSIETLRAVLDGEALV
ncbi:ABC transporter ATP-binding protein [Deinococcus sonorensis]|uniref:ATP-binding cassette domain-containing protein n=2 Tax=Deinococcus sonorensis TaxID=309891 RepID=A0AAU7U936_9DEIO